MEKVDSMIKHNCVCKIWKLMLAMILGVFISAFSFGASTVQAAETNVESTVGEQAADAENNSGAAMVLLMGGMLLIILAVVLSVVATFVSSAAIADEL